MARFAGKVSTDYEDMYVRTTAPPTHQSWVWKSDASGSRTLMMKRGASIIAPRALPRKAPERVDLETRHNHLQYLIPGIFALGCFMLTLRGLKKFRSLVFCC